MKARNFASISSGIPSRIPGAVLLLALALTIARAQSYNELDLIDAAGRGDLAAVTQLLREGADVNWKRLSDGSAALHEAAKNGHEDVVRALLAAGADIDLRMGNQERQTGDTPLIVAAREGQLDVVRALVAAGAKLNDPRLEAGGLPRARRMEFDRLRPLPPKPAYFTVGGYLVPFGNFDHLPSPEGEGFPPSPMGTLNIKGGQWTPLVAAAYGRHPDVVRELLAANANPNLSGTYYTALHRAVLDGNLGMMQDLIDAGANVNAIDFYKVTPLMLAADRGDVDSVKLLLAEGASVDLSPAGWRAATSESPNWWEFTSGPTALTSALINGHADVARELISAGADVNLKQISHDRPLTMAAAAGNVDLMRLLLDASAEVNAAEIDGRTALMEAATNGNLDAVRELLDAGADPNVALPNGVTAMTLASENGHPEVADLWRTPGGSRRRRGARSQRRAGVQPSFLDWNSDKAHRRCLAVVRE